MSRTRPDTPDSSRSPYVTAALLACFLTFTACGSPQVEGYGPQAVSSSAATPPASAAPDATTASPPEPITAPSGTVQPTGSPLNPDRAIRAWTKAMSTGTGGCDLLTQSYRRELREEAIAGGAVASDARCDDLFNAYRALYREFGYDATRVSASGYTMNTATRAVVDVVNPDGSGFGAFVFVSRDRAWLIDDITLPQHD